MAMFKQKSLSDEALEELERQAEKSSGVSLFHALTLGSIGLSLYLYWIADRKMDGIFVGLWAPTFEALRSSMESR